MAVKISDLKGFSNSGARYSYGENDTILYALGLGLGGNPLEKTSLDYVYEKDLQAVPTMATVIAWGANDIRSIGINYQKVLHAGQYIKIHQPLPGAADVVAEAHVKAVSDKGESKGSIIVTETNINLEKTGEPLCTLNNTIFARGDGGITDAENESYGDLRSSPKIPETAPSHTAEIKTAENLAAIYRLSGDDNPLHIDPEVALSAGFEKPILHGLCTMGLCCRALLESALDHDAALIESLEVKFTSVFYPGETLLVEMWRESDTVLFRASSKERGLVVIDGGLCCLRS